MIVVLFCGLLMCSAAVGFLAALALQKRGAGWLGVPLFAVVMVVCAAWLARLPAPVASQQEPVETGVAWPTETAWPESGWHDFYDALRVTDEQIQHDVGEIRLQMAAVQTYVWTAPSATLQATGIPMATATAVAAGKLCQACVSASDCGLNMTCYQCGQDKRWRCVWTTLRNGTCTQCINAGQ